MTESTALTTFDPVPTRPRHDGWTPERQRAFIEHLADTGCVAEAAARVDMTEQSAYRLRRRRDADAFDAAWEAALERGLQRLTAIAFERAIKGAPRRIYYHGELVAEERVFSDRLLIHLLTQARSGLSRSRERARVHEDWESWIENLDAADTGAPQGGFRLWQDEEGDWYTNLPPPERFKGQQFFSFGNPLYRRELSKVEITRLEDRGRLFATPVIDWIT
jgi:hypothetical protein